MQITEKELGVAIDYITAAKYQANDEDYKRLKRVASDTLEEEGERISEGTLFARIYFMFLEGQLD